MTKISQNPVTENVGAGVVTSEIIFTKVVSIRDIFYEWDAYGYEKEIYYLELESLEDTCLLKVIEQLFDKLEYDDSADRALESFKNIKSLNNNHLFQTWNYEKSCCYAIALHDAISVAGRLFLNLEPLMMSTDDIEDG
ncbi:MAG: hypothetical protein R3B41_02755 [Candidatus Doudnabacteria bacterium]